MDDAVYDACMEAALNELNSEDDEDAQEEIIAAAEHRASEINNRGTEIQAAFLRGETV